MTITATKTRSLELIKRNARKIKKATPGMRQADAENQAAVEAGYQSFRHAQAEIGQKKPDKHRPPAALTRGDLLFTPTSKFWKLGRISRERVRFVTRISHGRTGYCVYECELIFQLAREGDSSSIPVSSATLAIARVMPLRPEPVMVGVPVFTELPVSRSFDLLSDESPHAVIWRMIDRGHVDYFLEGGAPDIPAWRERSLLGTGWCPGMPLALVEPVFWTGLPLRKHQKMVREGRDFLVGHRKEDVGESGCKQYRTYAVEEALATEEEKQFMHGLDEPIRIRAMSAEDAKRIHLQAFWNHLCEWSHLKEGYFPELW